MKYMRPNLFRGLVGLLGIVGMMVGAWILWGVGAALFSSGLFLALDASSDEATERFTGISRYPQGTAHD